MSVNNTISFYGNTIDIARLKAKIFGGEVEGDGIDFSLDTFMPPPEDIFRGDMRIAEIAVQAMTENDLFFYGRDGISWPRSFRRNSAEEEEWKKDNTQDCKIVSAAEAMDFIVAIHPGYLEHGIKLLHSRKKYPDYPNIWCWRSQFHGSDEPEDPYFDDFSEGSIRVDFNTEDTPATRARQMIEKYLVDNIMSGVNFEWTYNELYEGEDGCEHDDWVTL